MQIQKLEEMSEKEIIDSLGRTFGTQYEQMLKAELTRRHTESLKMLSNQVYHLRHGTVHLYKILQHYSRMLAWTAMAVLLAIAFAAYMFSRQGLI